MRYPLSGRQASWLAATSVVLAAPLGAQQRDTTPRPSDSLRVFTLPPAVVSVTRANPPINRVPQAVELVDRTEINRARPTWGLDEALTTVPGVYAANRYNFSLDQRISIRGFGARAQFAVRGIKVLVDGIPQTLPDGTGQLTNLDLGDADRLEVLRGSASALFGNATGGVISIWTDPKVPEQAREEVTLTAGTFDRDLARNWSKWRSSTAFRVGSGSGEVTLSRLDYNGERQHSNADLRTLNSRWHFPVAPGWTLAAVADVGWNPRADNPGSLTSVELHANADSAAQINLTRNAGKDVTQGQGGITLHRSFADGGDATVSVYAFTRDLENPQTFAYIDLNRFDYGARASMSHPFAGALAPKVTAGIDFQRQRDDRVNYNYQRTAPTLADTSRQLDQLEHVTEVGPFLQTTLQLAPTVALTGGLRYDWVNFQVDDRLGTNSGSRLMQALSGSGGVSFTPSDAVTIYGNVGTSFETPTTTELVNRPSGATGFNPSLQPQKATDYELGARGDVAGRVNYSLALFQADVRDELVPYQAPPPAPVGRVFYQNAGTSRHRGIELGTELVIVSGLNLFTSWTYSDFRYVRYTDPLGGGHVLDGRALPGIPQHWLHVLLQARPAAVPGAWAELEETRSSGFFVDDTLNTYTSGWWTTNLRLGWEGSAGGVRLRPFVGFNNVFNRAYVSSVVINATARRYYEPAPGRNMYLGCSLGAGG